MQSPRPAAHGRHASPDPQKDDEAPLAIDLDGRPSMYSQAQDSAEVKGLTLHTDPFALRRDLQRSIEAIAARDKELQARSHTRRLQGLAAATVALWLTVLVVLLARL